MKTKIALLILAIVSTLNAFSQNSTMELTFTANYRTLDSILIENLTKGGDTTLYASDTVLVLDYVSSYNDHLAIGQNSFFVSQNYPNPFKEQTTISLYLPEREQIKITILDILGRALAQYENILNQGNHSFTFYSGKENDYLFSVTGKNISKTIKMLHVNSNSKQTGQCKIVYANYDENGTNCTLKRALNDFVFEPGDQLRYIGYAKYSDEIFGSDVIEDVPQTNKIYEFAITRGIPCPGTPTVTYEDKVYKTIQIGSQCWLGENLDVGTRIDGSLDQTDNSTIEKYCYDNDPENCNTYGGLYQWDEMMQYTTTQGVQGICPTGWHIPTDEEWKQLEGEVDSQFDYPDPEWEKDGWRGYNAGGNLKSSTTHWNNNGGGSDKYGFKALPNGNISATGSYWYLQDRASFWSSGDSEANSWERNLGSGGIMVERIYFGKDKGLCVRCVKD